MKWEKLFSTIHTRKHWNIDRIKLNNSKAQRWFKANIPIAEALLSKGALLGTILSFMMAVTTLSLPSLIMLKKVIKSKLLGTFIAICTVGIIIVGYGFNLFQYLFI